MQPRPWRAPTRVEGRWLAYPYAPAFFATVQTPFSLSFVGRARGFIEGGRAAAVSGRGDPGKMVLPYAN
eukprot:scaffold200497_cov31-Tisochrysis_lutea.AAC.1